ncbi:protoglobin domain-containing protein [Kribbia dieselivorans]|uniref:protoglobin domain-containing protein n=1 Tax=Kribbia dieselivorans TaxID=331526 RepID=UPI000839873B|nr:protoglobin domain-containing protein [Kribbia dieselivorans]
MTQVPGYSYGSPENTTSPVSLTDLDQLKATLLWSDDDERWRRRAGELLTPQAEDILDVWYGFVGSSPHLVSTFSGADGQPDGDYLAAVRRRFALWIHDTCSRDLDQAWLDQQHEIALRHTAAKKSATDGVNSTSAEVPLRYLVAFIVPLTVTVEPFLSSKAGPDDDVAAMMTAWFKAITLTATLWSQPYADGW